MSQSFFDAGKACKGQKVALCTTVYDKPSPAYTHSIQRSREALTEAGIGSAYYLLSGNCHVDDARNSIVQEFLLSDCTDLVFLDADVSWKPEQLVTLCQYDEDIVGGVYPFRRDEKAKENMPVVMYPGQVEPDARGLIEVAGLPAGFMRIRRNVLETLAKDADKFWSGTDRRAQIPIVFERVYLNGGRVGGDLNFCRKWVKSGGKVFAASSLRLGHTGTITLNDSLDAALRRQGRETLQYMVDRVRLGKASPELFTEARRYVDNVWGALEDVLMLCALMGKKSEGPIIETGTGLSTLVLAASTDQKVYCIEHDPLWAEHLKKLIAQTDLENIVIYPCAMKNGWYDTSDFVFPNFSLGLNDGPPRYLGSRTGFFKQFGYVKTIICDDADDEGYTQFLTDWCTRSGRKIDFIERAALIRGQDDIEKAA